MKIVNQKFVDGLKLTTGRAPRTRLNRMLGKIGKGESLFISRSEWKTYGYKSQVGAFVSKDLKKSVSIKTYKRGWVISKA